MEEQIIYPDWKTGKDVIKNLGLVGEVTITKTPLICPFDETPILKSSAHAWESYECPNCKTVYKTDTHTQKEVDVYARNHFTKLLPELQRLDEGRQNLVARIQQATEKGLIAQSQPKCTREMMSLDLESAIQSGEVENTGFEGLRKTHEKGRAPTLYKKD